MSEAINEAALNYRRAPPIGGRRIYCNVSRLDGSGSRSYWERVPY